MSTVTPERPDGWYWVRWTGPGAVLFDWTMRRWEEGEFLRCAFQPEIVGSRIPSQDWLERAEKVIAAAKALVVAAPGVFPNLEQALGDQPEEGKS